MIDTSTRCQLLKVFASLGQFNHRAPCAAKGAGIVDEVRAADRI